ncbi:muskelin isoform X2 [Cimex lectularius]|uniref:Muskelin N-terminal domain-containing protein n=1 Tax=Cimex lectularius TaxID=79782 RepID=A0A8I6S0I3_CIMLE|nr:muskelin isoform X2 [Cimex lectularius]
MCGSLKVQSAGLLGSPFTNGSSSNQMWGSRLESNVTPKEILLKLSKHAIIKAITFGKTGKSHLCSLRRFKIYGGLTVCNMIELVEGSLNSEDKEEAFMLKHALGGNPFACRYIKIIPLQCWGTSPTLYYSICSFELTGVDQWDIVKHAMDCVRKYTDEQSIKLCMKYLRSMNFKETFRCLEQESKMKIEHPSLEMLFHLVNEGLYDEVEDFITRASNNGLFNNHLSTLVFYPSWVNMELTKPRPGMRGGHQMCVDIKSGHIYLHGGWDGYQDINDLWIFDIANKKWNMVSYDTRVEGGPGPRSCHKMCLDYERREIYVLGRYLDLQSRNTENLKADFYVYHIDKNRWRLISSDTQAEGGPQLIYDHQMCIDIHKRFLYIFGGRILTSDMEQESSVHDRNNSTKIETGNDNVLYSGMYCYDITNNVWTHLCKDVASQDPSPIPVIKSRIGHSMLFHPVTDKLYIFAGHRNKTYLNDFFSYNIVTKKFEYISDGCHKFCNNFPASGFTQRATIDPNLNEIYVLTGFSKERLDNSLQNTFWSYSINKDEWTCLYTSLKVATAYWHREQYIEPCPRFAHQLVYDSVNKLHFLFGGNPGILRLPRIRLDDLWRLSFNRPTNEEILAQLKLIIRKTKFQELIHVDKVQAIIFLQNEVSVLIKQENEVEIEKLPKLIESVFHDCKFDNENDCIHEIRINLFETLSSYFPEEMAQPRRNIGDGLVM